MNKEKINNVVDYDDVLDNCGLRTSFDPRALQSQLSHYKNWKNIILKRHHQFVLSYLKGNYNLKDVKESLGYSIKDLESILLRVQSQFEMYEENNNVIFRDMYVNIYNAGVFSDNNKEEDLQEEILPDILFEGIDIPEIKKEPEVTEVIVKETPKKKPKVIKEPEVPKMVDKKIIDELEGKTYKDFPNDKEFFKSIVLRHQIFIANSYNGGEKLVRREKIKNLIELLSEIDNIKKYQRIFTDKIYKSICFLIKDFNLPEAAATVGVTKSYLTQILVGKEKPRCANEKGIIVLLEEYIERK